MFHTVYYKETRLGRFETLAEAKDAINKHWACNVGLPDAEFEELDHVELGYEIKSRRKTTREKWDARERD